MGGRASLTCAIEPPESHLRGHHSAGNPQQADHGDTEKGPGGTHSEQRATDQRTNYLNRELHGLEHALRARLLARLGHVTDLGVEARGARYGAAPPSQVTASGILAERCRTTT